MFCVVKSQQSSCGKRAYLAPEALRARGWAAGDWACIETAIVQLWPKGGLGENEILVDTTSTKVEPSLFDPATARIAKSVSFDGLTEGRDDIWVRAAIKESLVRAKYFTQHHSVSVDGTIYTVKSVQQSSRGLVESMDNLELDSELAQVYEMNWRTSIIVHRKAPVSKYEQLGGLDSQIKLVRNLLELPLREPNVFRQFGLTPPRGVLLYGPPGTGKTALARAVALSTPGCSCVVINGPELSSAFHGETEERLRAVFAKARQQSPCVIVLDEVDALCPRRDGDGGEVEKRVVATLLTLMDGMDSQDERIFVIAATNRPNSVDPALRRPGRFDREVEIGIPDAGGRRQILEILLAKMPNDLTPADMTNLADRTHGFVGADLSSLVRESALLAIQDNPPLLSTTHLVAILPGVRPSTMREVFVETPNVRWSDIGGQDMVKQKLRECVEWPLTHRETFLRLGVEAPRGILLYGPPGCSKTMTAKALATESGLNFLAVKGPELLNKYVGESERAVREIFRKARAAAPSIIFFDEIDALGSSRNDDSPHNGVLTSLLNEMDGVEELSGVVVVAATNRPDVLDDALMRPGRLDRILYVGPPDLATRRDIFRIRLSKMSVGSVDLDKLASLTEGCSGAEVASICQDAAISAMNENLNVEAVEEGHFVEAAKTVRRRITTEMVDFFTAWRDQSGVRSV